MAVEIDVRNIDVDTEAIRFTNDLKLVKENSGKVSFVDKDGTVKITLNKNQFASLRSALKIAEVLWD